MPEGTLPKQAEGLPPSLGRPAEMLLTMSGPFIDREYSDPSLKEHLTSFITLCCVLKHKVTRKARFALMNKLLFTKSNS